MTWIPGDRFIAVVERRKNWRSILDGTNAGERVIRKLIRGEQRFIGLAAADRVLARLDLTEWWHIPKEQGGLADIYEDGVQYGRPENLNGHVPSGRYPRKYASEEARLAARRESYRRSYERRKLRRAA